MAPQGGLGDDQLPVHEPLSVHFVDDLHDEEDAVHRVNLPNREVHHGTDRKLEDKDQQNEHPEQLEEQEVQPHL